MEKWIALAELVLANLAWIDELDLEGFLLGTALLAGAGAALWVFVGATWLLVAASLYLALLVAVRFATHRNRKD